MSKAAIKNHALAPLGVLIGKWETVGHHPLVPNTTLKGETNIQWLENGAFLIIHSQIDHKDFPDGIAILGSDDSDDERKYVEMVAE